LAQSAEKCPQPNIISYTTVFDACATAGKYTAAAQWLAKAAATVLAGDGALCFFLYFSLTLFASMDMTLLSLMMHYKRDGTQYDAERKLQQRKLRQRDCRRESCCSKGSCRESCCRGNAAAEQAAAEKVATEKAAAEKAAAEKAAA